MFSRTSLFALATALSMISVPLSAQETTSDTVVATVNGTDITIGHMIVLRDGLPDQYKQLPADVLFQGILDQLVQQTVLAQTVSEPSHAVALRLENERRTLLAGEAMSQALEARITDEALQTAYDERFADAEPSREFNASHILVETEAEAAALVDELSGGADFADLAKEKSTGPSGPNGGELGWFGPGMMVKPFEDAVMAMQAGDISQPVQTQFGWHVIKLNESRMTEAPSLDEMRADLTDELQRQAIDSVLEELTQKADIKRPDLSGIDPAIIGNADLVTD